MVTGQDVGLCGVFMGMLLALCRLKEEENEMEQKLYAIPADWPQPVFAWGKQFTVSVTGTGGVRRVLAGWLGSSFVLRKAALRRGSGYILLPGRGMVTLLSTR
jgi:hypothetical protein